jgi:hypothetical protein
MSSKIPASGPSSEPGTRCYRLISPVVSEELKGHTLKTWNKTGASIKKNRRRMFLGPQS